jgi:shikimate kinase
LVVLLGPKHSGKTSTGLELARRLELPFYDLDELIEKRTGQSPRALFNTGPEFFRKEEAAALAELLAGGTKLPKGENPGVLAAGGGIIDNPAAMELLQNKNHTTIYLAVSAETAWRRIEKGEIPPFLQAETMEKSREKHRLLHERRAGAYEKFAKICICAGEKNPSQLVEEICTLDLFGNFSLVPGFFIRSGV